MNKTIPKAKLSHAVKNKIRRILMLGETRKFPRCPAKSGLFLNKQAAKGDFSHHVHDHICEQCRCGNTAGRGTSGDFYGIGMDTGHFGVGYCAYHEKRLSKERAERIAREHVQFMQSYGDAAITADQFDKLSRTEASEVAKYNEMQRGIDLVLRTLREYEDRAKTGVFNEYVQGQLLPASDKSKIETAINLAKAIASIKKDEFRMDANSYIHVDQLKERMPKMIDLVKNLFAKERELVIGHKEGGRDPIEQVTEEWLKGLKEIWSDAKRGSK